MADKKMTTREFLTAVLKGELSQAVLEKALDMATKLDEANAKRKAAPKKRKVNAENEVIAAAIVDYLRAQEKPVLAKDVAAAVGESVQKASSLLRTLADEGKVTRFTPDNRNKPIEYAAIATDGDDEDDDSEDAE